MVTWFICLALVGMGYLVAWLAKGIEWLIKDILYKKAIKYQKEKYNYNLFLQRCLTNFCLENLCDLDGNKFPAFWEMPELRHAGDYKCLLWLKQHIKEIVKKKMEELGYDYFEEEIRYRYY